MFEDTENFESSEHIFSQNAFLAQSSDGSIFAVLSAFGQYFFMGQ
jgi:hypothetical protein